MKDSQYVEGRLFSDYSSVGSGFLEKMLAKYRCKKCGHLGKMNIITNAPLDIICESCEREEKIDDILGSI